MAAEVLENPLPEVEADLAADGPHTNGSGVAEEGPYHSHWASVIGAFKDDPAFDELMEIIRQRRREMNADDSIE